MHIEPHHFKYLVIQRGEVSDFRHDFQEWKQAYENSLQRIFESIKPVLPATCSAILDVGSGLGGIDILLDRYYRECAIRLYDGEADPPEVRFHAEPFNDMTVAMDFLRANGVHNRGWFKAPHDTVIGQFDLIVSFAAYGFHIPPAKYLRMLQKASKRGTTVIFDMRKDKPEWKKLLSSKLCGNGGTVLHEEEKLERVAWVI